MFPPSPETIPYVSVCVISYNHAPFVESALRSVLAQETPFPFEVVFADDCSTDGTRAIAERVARGASVPFRFLPRTRNLGPRENVLDLFASARGVYIAYLEADDRWVDPTRLATQVALLDARHDLSGCFGRAHVLDASDNMLGDYFEYHGCAVPDPEVDEPTTIARGSSAPSCTHVFRRDAIHNPPAWYVRDGSHQGLSVVLAGRGPLKFVDRVWGHYHVHAGGVWSMASRESKYAADFRYAVALASDAGLASRYPQLIGRRLALSSLTLARERLRRRMGVRSILTIARGLQPAATRTALRAVVIALPDLARIALEKTIRAVTR